MQSQSITDNQVNLNYTNITHGCCPYLGLREPWAAASSSILRVGSIPYILLYCICWAVNMAAWLSMMQLKRKFIKNGFKALYNALFWLSCFIIDLFETIIYLYSVYRNEENEVLAIFDNFWLKLWLILGIVLLSTKAHLCFCQ